MKSTYLPYTLGLSYDDHSYDDHSLQDNREDNRYHNHDSYNHDSHDRNQYGPQTQNQHGPQYGSSHYGPMNGNNDYHFPPNRQNRQNGQNGQNGQDGQDCENRQNGRSRSNILNRSFQPLSGGSSPRRNANVNIDNDDEKVGANNGVNRLQMRHSTHSSRRSRFSNNYGINGNNTDSWIMTFHEFDYSLYEERQKWFVPLMNDLKLHYSIEYNERNETIVGIYNTSKPVFEYHNIKREILERAEKHEHSQRRFSLAFYCISSYIASQHLKWLHIHVENVEYDVNYNQNLQCTIITFNKSLLQLETKDTIRKYIIQWASLYEEKISRHSSIGRNGIERESLEIIRLPEINCILYEKKSEWFDVILKELGLRYNTHYNDKDGMIVELFNYNQSELALNGIKEKILKRSKEYREYLKKTKTFCLWFGNISAAIASYHREWLYKNLKNIEYQIHYRDNSKCTEIIFYTSLLEETSKDILTNKIINWSNLFKNKYKITKDNATNWMTMGGIPFKMYNCRAKWLDNMLNTNDNRLVCGENFMSEWKINVETNEGEVTVYFKDFFNLDKEVVCNAIGMNAKRFYNKYHSKNLL